MLALVAIAAALFWLADGPLDAVAYYQLQRDWFLGLNGELSAAPALFWSNVTRLGDGRVLFPLLSGLMIWKPRTLISVLGCVPAAAVFSKIGKWLAAVKRPPAVLDHESFTIVGRGWSGDGSLPSGHSIVFAAAAVAFLAVVLPAPRGWRQWSAFAGVLAAAALGCLSRVAVGVHWPLDILAGAAFGWVAGLNGAALARYDRWHWDRSRRARRIVGAVLLVWSLVVMKNAAVAVDDALVLWLSGLSGAAAALWLLTARPRAAVRASAR